MLSRDREGAAQRTDEALPVRKGIRIYEPLQDQAIDEREQVIRQPAAPLLQVKAR